MSGVKVVTAPVNPTYKIRKLEWAKWESAVAKVAT